MSSTVDYLTASATWRLISTAKKDGSTTDQWQATIRYQVEQIGDDGNVVIANRRKTKLFPPSVDTDRKKSSALKAWRKQLAQQQAEELERASREEAERASETLPTEPAEKSVYAYATQYLDEAEAIGAVRPSAIADYRTSAKRVGEAFPDVAVKDLTPAMIQAWEAEQLKSGRAVNTVLKYHRFLNLLYNRAIELGHVDRNPCIAVKKPRRVAPSPNALTAEQAARLARTLDQMGASAAVTAASIALNTGMRLGEVCALRWREYDPDAGTIHVVLAAAKAGGKSYLSEPKTAASVRYVPVSPDLAHMLDRRRARMEAELEEAGIQMDPEEFGRLFVVGSIAGGFANTVVISRQWTAISEALGLVGTQGRKVGFHDLRHAFATRAIAAGADVKAVAAVLGHSNAAITLNVYADADAEAKRRAVTLTQRERDAQGTVEPYAIDAEARPWVIMLASGGDNN